MPRSNKLCTPLRHLGQVMPDGIREQRYPPVPEASLWLIDPEFTRNRYGFLDEKAGKGLRCPVRGCGDWYHRLSAHIAHKHADVCSVQDVRDALGLGRVSLVSVALSAKLSKTYRKRWPAGKPVSAAMRKAKLLRGALGGAPRVTANVRNLRHTSAEQLLFRFKALSNKLGKVPSVREARAEFTSSFEQHVSLVFGTWNNMIDQAGLGYRGRNGAISRGDALSALRDYHARFGRLPSSKCAPQCGLPNPDVYRRLFKTNSWSDAMRQAATLLHISPESTAAAAELKKRRQVVTQRYEFVLHAVARGKSSSAIAKELGIGLSTVERFRRRARLQQASEMGAQKAS